MMVPVSMLRTAGGAKVAALLAVLAGLALATTMKNQPRATNQRPPYRNP